MSSGRLLTDDLILPDLPTQNTHPMDSSRVLLGLMTLSRQAAEDSPGDTPLEGVIAPGVLRSLLSALHFRDVTTVRHARRVAMLSLGIAQYLGWEGRHLKILEVSALLHDIGKIGVPDNILFKPGALSPDEAELMSLHHNIGVDVLQACRVDSQVLEIVGHSHSFYNGATDGFRRIGSDVPLGARILAVADAYDSLSTDQVYRKAKTHPEIMKILMDQAGTQFDGNLVCALARWTQHEGASFIHQAHESFSPAPPPPTAANSSEGIQASTLCHIFSYLYFLESLYDGFYLVDSDLRFVVWNRGAEKLLGHETHDILGRVWTSRTLHYADKQSTPFADSDCPMHQVVATGKATTTMVKMQHVDGQWKDVELQTVPLVDQYHRLQGVAEIFRDLSRNNRKPQEYHALRMAASRDPLTSVANRGELETQLAMLVSEFSQQKSGQRDPFSVIFLDVDHFKSINDTFGHTVGDKVLIEVARLLQHETYSGELVGRYGGEEFVVLCPSTKVEQAVKRAERLRMAIARTNLEELGERKLTASFGVSEVEPGDSVESLLRRADKALYMAKEGGRNQTRSLTCQQLEVETQEKPQEEQAPARLDVFEGAFAAFLPADMVVYKLGGFLHDSGAKVDEITDKRAAFRLGSAGLLPFWGSSDDRRPVSVELELGKPEPQVGRSATSKVPINVRIRPIGWVRNYDIFQARAGRVYKDLLAYFVAEAR